MEIIKVTPRGYCKGVTRAISLAKKTVIEYPNEKIYILGMLVHNTHVMRALQELNVIAIDDKRKTRMELLDEIKEGVVIFTAHGISPSVVKKAIDKGLVCIDASCPDVLKTQEIVTSKLGQGYDVFYIGKKAHPEAEAICSLHMSVHLVTGIDDVLQLSDEENRTANKGSCPSYKKIFVTNQTTMSIFDIEEIFATIKKLFPNAEFSEEICNATRIRQQAVAQLRDKEIDVVYVVGDKYSNNSNRLAQIAREQGIPQVYLIDDVSDILQDQLRYVKRVAVTSGASTPTYLTRQVISYLESYTPGAIKPIVDITKVL